MRTIVRGSSTFKMALDAVGTMHTAPKAIRIEEASPVSPVVGEELVISLMNAAYGGLLFGGIAMLLRNDPTTGAYAAAAGAGLFGAAALWKRVTPQHDIQWAEWGNDEVEPAEDDSPPPAQPMAGWVREGNQLLRIPDGYDDWHRRFHALIPRMLELRQFTYKSWSPKSAGLFSRNEWDAVRFALLKRGLIDEAGSAFTPAGLNTIEHWHKQREPRAAFVLFVRDILASLTDEAGADASNGVDK